MIISRKSSACRDVLEMFSFRRDRQWMVQLILSFDERPGTLDEIHRRLHERFGRQGPWFLPDPMSQLVLGLLGGRTYSDVSMAAYNALKARFDSWEQVRDSPVAEIWAIISAVTYAEVKAPRLQAALQAITATRGQLTLDFLHGLTVDEALEWLERLPGVGRKGAAATLNFSSLRKAALVIDTHHLRVLRRLGLSGPHCSAKQAYDRLMPILPTDWGAEDMDEHHQLMKALGQTTCRHRAPACDRCPLNDLCPSAATGSAGA